MKKRMLRFSLDKEEDACVARCLDIDVASDGKSEAEAIANLEEALALYGDEDGWAPMLVPDQPVALAGEERAWLDMPPVGREIT